jgi:hypothetical protein
MIRFFWQNQDNEAGIRGPELMALEGTMALEERRGAPTIVPEIPLIQVTVNHQEGKPATLKMTVPSWSLGNAQNIRGRWGKLTYRGPEKLESGSRESESLEPESRQSKSGKSQSLDPESLDLIPPEVLIFYGKVSDILEKPGIIEMTLVADKGDFQKDWEMTSQRIMAMGHHHDVWGNADPETLLAAIPYVHYWDRCTGEMTISHVCVGEKKWDLSQQYDPKYRIFRKNTPITHVNVEVSAHWVQMILGYSDIAADIARCFPNGVMGTLTDRAFESAWPESGKIFSSGYFIAESQLTKITDARYPSAIVFRAQQNADGSKRGLDLVAQCSFYTGQLVVGYMYRQKRKEVLTYQLQAALPEKEEGRTTSIKLALPPFVKNDDLPLWHPLGEYDVGDLVQHEGRVYIHRASEPDTHVLTHHRLTRTYDGAEKSPPCWEELPEKSKWLLPSVSDSFFKETLGQEIFKHTLERAKTALNWGLRCIEIEVRGTMHDWHNITLNDGIILQKSQDNEEKISGKVVEYTLHMDAVQSCAYVQIKGAFSVALDEKSTHKHPDIQDDLDAYTIQEMDGLSYGWPKKEPSGTGVDQEMRGRIFKKIAIKNTMDQQLKCIKGIQEKMLQSEWDPASVQAKETCITMNFHSLRAKECLEHLVAVQMRSRYPGSKD